MGWYSAAERSLENPATPLGTALHAVHGGPRTPAGVRINEDNALTISAVWRAVNAIAQQVATIPVHVYRRLDRGKERVPDHRVARLLRREPNPYMLPSTFIETLQAHVLVWGNGYAHIEWDSAGRPVALWPLTPDRVTVMMVESVRVPGRVEKWYVVRLPGGGERRIAADDMLHVPGLGWNGLVGRSVIALARESLGLAKAAERYGAYYFGQGSRASGVIETPPGYVLTDEVEARLRRSWHEIHEGLENSHRIAILEEGMKFRDTSIPPDDAQFLETRQFQTIEVARWFGVPPHILYDLTRSTFSNIEHQSIEFDRDTLRPWIVKWEQALNARLFTARAAAEYYVEYLMDGVLRADTETRGKFYQTLTSLGAFSPNDIRERENLNPIDGGDRYFVRRDTWPLDRVDDLVARARDDAAGTDADRSRLARMLISREAGTILRREIDQLRARGRNAPDTGIVERHRAWVRERFALVAPICASLIGRELPDLADAWIDETEAALAGHGDADILAARWHDRPDRFAQRVLDDATRR